MFQDFKQIEGPIMHTPSKPSKFLIWRAFGRSEVAAGEPLQKGLNQKHHIKLTFNRGDIRRCSSSFQNSLYEGVHVCRI